MALLIVGGAAGGAGDSGDEHGAGAAQRFGEAEVRHPAQGVRPDQRGLRAGFNGPLLVVADPVRDKAAVAGIAGG
ncbi:hypothetical protein NKH77_35685 [Streptomyces sp. M19]